MTNILILIYVTGWFSPKISIFGEYFASLQDIVCIILIFKYFILNKLKLVKLFRYELLFCFLLILVGFKEFFFFDSFYGLIYSFRILSYVLLGSLIFNDKNLNFENILKYSIFVISLILGVELLIALYNIIIGNFNFNVLLFGYDKNLRINNYFETGTTSIPIGYLVAILFGISIHLNNKFLLIFSSIISLFTASRGSWLSIIIIYISALFSKKIKKSFLTNLIFIIILLVFAYLFYLKIFPIIGSFQLDYSSSIRIIMFKTSIIESLSNPLSLLFGNAINPSLLEQLMAFSFYESFNFHSLIQGGIFLFILTFLIYYKNFKFLKIHKTTYLFYGIITSNVIAGNNYFSVYSYPLMVIFFAYLNSKTN